jgi:hypothetical protein
VVVSSGLQEAFGAASGSPGSGVGGGDMPHSVGGLGGSGSGRAVATYKPNSSSSSQAGQLRPFPTGGSPGASKAAAVAVSSHLRSGRASRRPGPKYVSTSQISSSGLPGPFANRRLMERVAGSSHVDPITIRQIRHCVEEFTSVSPSSMQENDVCGRRDVYEEGLTVF